MIRIVICLQIVWFLGFQSCSSGPDIQKMDSEIMIIHDEVMPLMVEMKKARKQLEDKSESLDSIEASTYRESIRDLRKAEDDMWDWMNQYKKPSDKSPESVAYLDSQKIEIQRVSDAMKSSLHKAQSLLK